MSMLIKFVISVWWSEKINGNIKENVESKIDKRKKLLIIKYKNYSVANYTKKILYWILISKFYCLK